MHWFTAKHKYGYGYNNPLKWIDPLGMYAYADGYRPRSGGSTEGPDSPHYEGMTYVPGYGWTWNEPSGEPLGPPSPSKTNSPTGSSHGCITPFELTMMAAGGLGTWIGFGLGGTLGAFAGNFFPALYAASSTYARWLEGEAETDQLIQALGGFLPGYSLISLIISILSNPSEFYVETETFF